MKSTTMLLVRMAALAVLLGLCSPAALAKWAVRPMDVPVERLLENTRAVLRKNPADAQAYYVLGRLHSMAFAQGKDELSVASAPGPLDRALPEFVPWESVLAKRRGKAPKLLKPQELVHLEGSIRNYRQAVELWSGPLGKERPRSTDLPKEEGKEKAKTDEQLVARAMLGLAWMLEEAATLREAVAAGMESDEFAKLDKDDQAAIKKLAAGSDKWPAESLESYRGVVKLTADRDKRRAFDGPAADSLMSADAARAIVRLLEARKTTFVEREEIAAMKAHLKTFERIGRAVTPIIFPAEAPQPLERLVDAKNHVDFDLAADGLGHRWPWVSRDTCLLVWDPARTGEVRDGRQLFGSVTWWIFWNDGYEPLAALDNNADGWLAGDELAGLAVWQDRNGNGRSDRGEVVPVAERGIRRIAARAQGRQAGVLTNAHGIELNSGVRLPTYDWMPVSVPRSEK
jgi:hypothetical protein